MPQSRFIPYKDTLPNDLSLVREDILNALQAGLQRVQRHCPSSKPGIYIGAGGHILTTWHLFDALPAQRQTLPALRADLSQFPLSRPSSASRASFLETAVGTASLVLAQYLRTPALDEPAAKRAAAAAKVVRDAVRLGVTEERDEDGCEVLYGRAGLLYALLFLRAEVRRAGRDVGKGEEGGAVKGKTSSLVAPLVDDENVGALVDDIVARGAIGAEAYAREVRNPDVHVPPLMWSWHGKRYLGGAHGVAGILQMLLCCPSHLVERHWSAIEGTIEWLLGLQQPSGNWPHKVSRHGAAEAEEDDPLIQWCHGAPGMLILLATLLREHEVKSRMAQVVRDALTKGGRAVYERGLLRKGVGVCHGVAGSVYALLAVSDALDDPAKPRANGEWFRAALHLAHLACSYESLTARGEMATPDRPYSLYEGVAGMCYAWGDVLALLDGTRRRAGMPGYDDLDDV